MVSKDQIIHDLALAFAQEEYRLRARDLPRKDGDFIPRAVLLCDLYTQGVAVAKEKMDDITQSYEDHD